MEEKLVTLETAKLAKEKSFNWSTYMIWMFEYPYYMSEKKDWYHRERNYYCDIPLHEPWCYSPTQSHLAKWLREIHGIQVYVYSSAKNDEGKYRDYVVYINGIAQNDARDEEYQTYEDAMELGLQNALKMIN